MKPGWLILWAVVVWQVAGWAFAPLPKPPPAIASRPVPTDIVEQSAIQSRGRTRENALAALDRPWRDRCGTSRKDFVSAVGGYYYRRQTELERYPEIYGKSGHDYALAQWSTPDDSRIERLTQEAYARAFLKLSDFDDVATRMVAAVVKNERVSGAGCPG